MKEYKFKQIGVIETPFEQRTNIPIQAAFSTEKGIVHVFESYETGLTSLENFSHIILLYVFHKSELPDTKAVRLPHSLTRLARTNETRLNRSMSV
ncbi:MAG: TrmO family methyltransferase [Promethearchaeota archaeon]